MRESRFIPLVEYLRPKPAEQNSADESPLPQSSAEPPVDDLRVGAAARRFYARMEDALHAALPALLADCVHTILGRELRFEPADFRSVVTRLIESLRDEEPIRCRVHPSRIEELACDLPLLGDPSLGYDDCVFEVRSGSFDARLSTRIDALIARAGNA